MSEPTDAMCSEGQTLVNVASEMDDRRPHGQVSRMTERLLDHLRGCVVCKDALGPYAELLLTIDDLSGITGDKDVLADEDDWRGDDR